MSHDPLTMYIFQPMLLRPIGMMNTNTSLNDVSQEAGRQKFATYANAFSAKDVKATPLARIE